MKNNEIQDEITEVTLTDQNGQEYKVYYIWHDTKAYVIIITVDCLLSVNFVNLIHIL